MKLSKLARSLLVTALCVGLSMPTPALAQAPNQAAAAVAAPANPNPTMYGLTYGRPFFDRYEWRDAPRRHLYIHGGFEDSHLRFSLYLPPREQYQRRSLLVLEGGTGGTDMMMAAPGAYDWAFDVAFQDMGAYLVETNEGHWPDEGLGTDNPRDLWQASGYATRYARTVAEQFYGAAPEHGYVTGCSGGGTRASRHMENMPDLFDGAVAEAWGHLGNEQWSSYGLAGALLGDRLAQVRDAMDVGGSHDPYQGLSPLEADAVRDWLAMGVSRDGVSQWRNEGWFAAPFQLYHMRDTDPSYFTDFWTQPGYMGHDHPELLAPLLVDTTVTIESISTVQDLRNAGVLRQSTQEIASYGPDHGDNAQFRQGATIRFDGSQFSLNYATLTILSGPDRGRDMVINPVAGHPNLVQPFVARASYGFTNVQPGDSVRISNRDYIAYLFYYRHNGEVTTDLLGLREPPHRQLYPEFRALMNPDGSSKYVQRSGPAGYVPQTANFRGRIIALSGSADIAIWPTSMSAYIRRVQHNLGRNVDDQFRMYWVDNHPHCGGALTGPASTELIPVTGMTQQALRDLVRWVEQDVPPPANTSYSFASDNALTLPQSASRRRGIQPVASLTVNGGQRIEVRVGQPVTFVASGEAPPRTGTIVRAEFDFDGQGTWPEAVEGVNGQSSRVRATTTHVYDRPGTYFATFRVGSHRDGANGHGQPIYDIARVRVVVR